jgi:hypothetical protein
MTARSDGLEDLAAMTGGEFFRVSGRANSIFDRILRQTSSYYVATLEVDEADRTGRERQLVVTVERSGAVVRARRSFVVPQGPNTPR